MFMLFVLKILKNKKWRFLIIVFVSYTDDDTQQDMFNNSDEEKEEEENETDSQWRKERYEREKWLTEQQVTYTSTCIFTYCKVLYFCWVKFLRISNFGLFAGT